VVARVVPVATRGERLTSGRLRRGVNVHRFQPVYSVRQRQDCLPSGEFDATTMRLLVASGPVADDAEVCQWFLVSKFA
ncbi:MAG: hypothetical protein ACOYOM_15845, partial [Chloroflexota bacterium]